MLGVEFANCADGGLVQIVAWEDCKMAGDYFSENIGGPGGADDSVDLGYDQNPPGCYLQMGTTYFNPVGFTNTIACKYWASSQGLCLCKPSGTV